MIAMVMILKYKMKSQHKKNNGSQLWEMMEIDSEKDPTEKKENLQNNKMISMPNLTSQLSS